MTTTPERKTPEQTVHDVLKGYGMLDGTRAHAAQTIVAALSRAAGLLGGDPTEDQIEAVARELACLDEGDSWPTNAQLGGSLTGDRDVEYREGMREQARDLLLVAARAAGVAPQDELPVASALPVGDDSGHAGGDDCGSREDGPEEEGCSHRTTVAGAPQEPAEASFTERRRLAEHAWAGYRAVAGGPEAVPAWFGAGFTLGMNAERSRAGVAPQEPSAHANPLATSPERVKN